MSTNFYKQLYCFHLHNTGKLITMPTRSCYSMRKAWARPWSDRKYQRWIHNKYGNLYLVRKTSPRQNPMSLCIHPQDCRNPKVLNWFMMYTGHHYSRRGLWSHPGSHQSPFKATYRDRHWSAIPDYHTSLSIFRSGPFFGFSDDPCRRDAGNGGVSVWDDVECFLLLGGRRCVAQVS